MVVSVTPKTAELGQLIRPILQSLKKAGTGPVVVAYSGGRDSTALLHATVQEAGELKVKVLALHVHHGLSAHAENWLAHCQLQCEGWSSPAQPIHFEAHRLTHSPSPGASVEAWARQARYSALGAMALAHGASTVLLAHHRRDQAETVLLQALRGAGTAGWSGMPGCVQREGLTWWRPWLEQPRSQIDAYINHHKLQHIEDDSNQDLRFARNRLRLQVWPTLTAAFNQAEGALCAAADWAQQAHAALEELATLDLANTATADGLQLTAWLALSPARRSNALRAWIKLRHGQAAPASLIQRLSHELPLCKSARWPLGSAELCVHRGVLRYSQPFITPADTRWPSPSTTPQTHLCVRGTGLYPLPSWGGSLDVRTVVRGCEAGIPLAWLAQLELRARAGAERFQANLGRPARSLKKQYQEASLPAWERHGPLIYSGGQLVFVPGLGLDARVWGLPEQARVSLHWVAATARTDAP
jgi:tRNA(Ile)-lysidine synthase